MKTVDLDELLNNVFEVDSDKIKDIGNIEVPDFEKTMYDFKNKIELKTINTNPLLKVRRRNHNVLKKVAVVICLLITAFAFSFINEAKEVKAFKFSIIKTFTEVKDNVLRILYTDQSNGNEQLLENSSSDAIETTLAPEEVQNKLPFHLYIPEYLPKGYTLKHIKWSQYPGNLNMVEQLYTREKQGSISIYQTENRGSTDTISNINTNNGNIKKISIDNIDVTFIISNADTIDAVWYKNNAKYEIIGSISEEQAIKLIKSLK